MRRWTWRTIALAVVLVLVAGACGRDDDDEAETPSGATTTEVEATAAPGDFGDLKEVCGPGDAKGATDKGVTDTEINVATMSDPGNTAVPGLNQEIFDAGDAFVGWCNEAGGILGRKIVLHKRDAALFEVAARMIEACQTDFMLVGNGTALDATGVEQRTGCGLPEMPAFDVSVAAGTAPLTIMPLPVPADASNLGGALRRLAEVDVEAITHYGLISSIIQSIKDSGDRDRAAAETLGYTNVHYEEAPVQIDNYRPYVENLKSAGVQVWGYQGNPATTASMYKTMSDVGYFPKFTLLNANNYDPALISLGGEALTGSEGGVYVNVFIVPFELADDHPGVKKFIELLDEHANGAKPKGLGVNSFSAWLLWAQAAKECGSELTRQCVMDNAGSVKGWTGGGLHAPQNPGNALSGGSECFVLLKATPSGFEVDKEITKPNEGIFNCDPANFFKLKGFPKS